MKNLILFLIFNIILILSISSCGETNNKPKGIKLEQTALEYNEYIIGEHNKIMLKMLEFSKAFESAETNRMNHMLNLLNKQIKSSLSMISKLEAFNGDDKFKEAAVELFEFYESITEDEFKEMVDIQNKKGNRTIDDDERMSELNKSVAEREYELDKKLSEAHREFAKKNSAQIQKNKLQDSINKLNK